MSFSLVNWALGKSEYISTVCEGEYEGRMSCQEPVPLWDVHIPPGSEKWLSEQSSFVTIAVDGNKMLGYYNLNAAIQYRELTSKVSKYCSRYRIHYYFVPELTKTGNIHLHGIVECESNQKKLFKNWVKVNIGGYSKIFDKIASPKDCYNYCHKEGLYNSPLYRIIDNYDSVFVQRKK